MTDAERLRRVEHLFEAALKLEPTKRGSFVVEACGSDELLRNQVESLLAHHDSAWDLLDASAGTSLESMLQGAFGDSGNILTGQNVGGCKIIRQLGAGGMGEVWLAEDIELGRKVAVKLLSVGNEANTWLTRRLIQEARTASALNHPNILTVHDAGDYAGRSYIVSEYVEGVSLRQRLRASKLTVAETTDIACQIAAGLAAAHTAGIVHRDIKPENVMLRPDGLVKVLDFGIAKWSAQPSHPTLGENQTAVGAILGTADYMSPEQCRGGHIDARSDLWSLGIVLFEMVSGTRPTPGAPVETAVAYLPTGRLRHIVRKLLQPEPQDRYVSAAVLLLDLQEVKTRSKQNAAWTGNRGLYSAVAVIVGAIGASVWLVNHRPAAPHTFSHVTRLTSVGNVLDAAISPDGHFVAYTAGDSEQQGLWIKQIPSNSDEAKVRPARVTYAGVTFNPGNTQVYYLMRQERDPINVLYTVPIIGGMPRMVMEDVDSPVTFSPDGKQIAFVRNVNAEHAALIVADAIEGRALRAFSHSTPNALSGAFPAWSPDGTVIAFAVQEHNSPTSQTNIVTLEPKSGSTKVITSQKWRSVSGLSWAPGTNELIAVAWQNDSNFSELFKVDTRSGAVEQISHELTSHSGASMSLDGSKLVTIQRDRNAALWVADADNLDHATRITSEASRYYGLSWTADGQLISFNASGKSVLEAVSLDNVVQPLTDGGARDWTPEVIKDGRFIVFSSQRSGSLNIWRMDRNGRHVRQLTTGVASDQYPGYSSECDCVIFVSDRSGATSLWTVPFAGGAVAPLGSYLARRPVVSSDGQLIACEYKRSGRLTSEWSVAIVPVGKETPVKTFPNIHLDNQICWLPSGGAFTFTQSRGGVSNLWLQPVDGTPPRQLTHFAEGRIFWSAWSKEGGRLGMVRGRVLNDLVLLGSD